MTSTTPLVDVVVLSWNRMEDTAAAVDSVLSQDLDSLALWIIDQGSRTEQIDALKRMSAQHPAVHLVELGHNVGVPAGRNIGIGYGSADFVVCLDNDAIFESPRAISMAVDRLASDPRLAAVAFRALDDRTRRLDLASWAYPRTQMDASEPLPVARFVGVGHALRRTAFTEAGGYDGSLFFCEEELDLSYRMIEAGYRILYDPSIVILHKRASEERMDWERGRVYHQVRNAVLVHHRHHQRLLETTLLAAGWLLRGFYNGQGRQALKGVKDAIRLLDVEADATGLSREARQYVWEHDLRLRGSWLQRLRHDVLSTLPAREGDRASLP